MLKETHQNLNTEKKETMLIDELKRRNELLIRCLLILISSTLTIIITVIVIKGSSNASFTSNLEFASTLSSIILSVIAIIYTLVGNKSAELTYYRIVDAKDIMSENNEKLKEINSELLRVTDTVTKVNFDSIIENVQKSHDSFTQYQFRTDTRITTYLKNIIYLLNRSASQAVSSALTEIKDTDEQFKLMDELECMRTFLTKLFEDSTRPLGKFIFALFMFYLEKIEDGNHKDFLKYIKENIDLKLLSNAGVKDIDFEDFLEFITSHLDSIHRVLRLLDVVVHTENTFELSNKYVDFIQGRVNFFASFEHNKSFMNHLKELLRGYIQTINTQNDALYN